MEIHLINNLTKVKYIFENLEDNYRSTDLFYAFDIKLESGMPDGEYTLILFEDGVKMVETLAQIGDYVPERTSYNNENENGYIVYGE